MIYVALAGKRVSRLCFGSLTMGPLQKNLNIDAGAELIVQAFLQGVNFIDTAELYGTYPYIKEANRRLDHELVVAPKSYAYDRDGAKKAIDKARREMDLDVLDVFMMHEQETQLTLRGHREALDYYLEQKAKGIIRAVGVSTHAVEVVNVCALMPEIDLIHPIVNMQGLGIIDGNIEQMLDAIKLAASNKKFILGMKPLGGGNLRAYEECMRFVLDKPEIHAIAMGMQTKDEIDMNVAVFEGREPSDDLAARCAEHQKALHVADWCECCGKCAERCQMGALKIVNDKLLVNEEICVTCGYCSAACKQFALKVY